MTGTGPADAAAGPTPGATADPARPAVPGSQGMAGAGPAEVAAMRRALQLAATPGVPRGPNPRVGCVLLDRQGRIVGEGHHRGAGTAHAEVDALRGAGALARGATAVVTLEPCAHTGRTGPCTRALRDAGVRRVVFGQLDPNPVAAGGARELAQAGVEVVGGVLAEECAELNGAWSFAVTHGRPLLTWKVAASLDGRVAASDGSSRWITGPQARADVHRLRSQVDAVLIGTGTALADDPSLTVRDADGALAGRQPLRVVMGRRPIPPGAALRDGRAPLLVYPDQSPPEVLGALAARDVQHVLLEGGPTLAAAFVRARLVDRVVWYVAPVLLGAGAPAVGGLGVDGIDEALRLQVCTVTRIGHDVRVDATMGPVTRP